MRFYIFIGAVSMMLLTLGCGSQGGTLNLTVDSAAPGASGNNTLSKPLLNLWVESNNNFQLDLRTAKLAVLSDVTITAITGQSCACKVLIQGGEASGNMTLSSCSGTFQYCASFNSAGTYAKSSSDLQICTASNSCTILR